MAAMVPRSNGRLYSSVKAFNQYFSEGICLKYKTDFDVLTVTPWFVQTNMSSNRPIAWNVCSPQECAEGSLRSLGNIYRTYGSRRHVFIGFFID